MTVAVHMVSVLDILLLVAVILIATTLETAVVTLALCVQLVCILA